MKHFKDKMHKQPYFRMGQHTNTKIVLTSFLLGFTCFFFNMGYMLTPVMRLLQRTKNTFLIILTSSCVSPTPT